MPLTLVTLDPQTSPKSYFEQAPEATKPKAIPNGTGLQILFQLEEKLYVLAGSRLGKLLTVNGGAIKKNDQVNPYFSQLQEEYKEETFGVLTLESSVEEGYVLNIKGYGRYKLQMHETLCTQAGGSSWAYNTFTATCAGEPLDPLTQPLSLKDLEDIALSLSPTAKFWNDFGSPLFIHLNALKDKSEEFFQTYWADQQASLTQLFQNLSKKHTTLKEQNLLLVCPIDDLKLAESILALGEEIKNYKTTGQLATLAFGTIGEYSERPYYAVYEAEAVAALDAGKVKTITDTKETHKETAIFNKEVPVTTYPPIMDLMFREELRQSEDVLREAVEALNEEDDLQIAIQIAEAVITSSPASSPLRSNSLFKFSPSRDAELEAPQSTLGQSACL